jgi:hypothetical protein
LFFKKKVCAEAVIGPLFSCIHCQLDDALGLVCCIKCSETFVGGLGGHHPQTHAFKYYLEDIGKSGGTGSGLDEDDGGGRKFGGGGGGGGSGGGGGGGKEETYQQEQELLAQALQDEEDELYMAQLRAVQDAL